MKLTVTSATNYDKKKDGGEMRDSKGNKKYRSVIKTVEKGEETLSGFVFKPLNAGDIIEAELKPETYNGQTRMTFNITQSGAEKVQGVETGLVLAEMKNHTVFLKQILSAVEGIHMSLSTHQTIEAIKKPSTILTAFDEENIGEFPTEAMPVEGEDDFGTAFD